MEHFVFRQAVAAMKRGLVPFEGNLDPVAVLVVDFRPQLAQHMADVIDVDIRAHGMSEERMQNFTMMVIHASLGSLTG